MAHVRGRHALLAVVGTSLMILGGCASHSTEVENSWMARVPEAEMGSVRQAEAAKRQAVDGVMRADVAVDDAQRALEVARHDVDMAKIGQKSAEDTLKAAELTGQRATIDQAQAQLRTAGVAQQAARAEVAWREQNVDAWKAQKRLRERENTLADAQLSYARYVALKQHGDVRAEKISEDDLRSSVSDARSKVLEARRDADAKSQQAHRSQVAWEQLRSQTRGYGGSGMNQR
jgi:colicin import membrane protein